MEWKKQEKLKGSIVIEIQYSCINFLKKCFVIFKGRECSQQKEWVETEFWPAVASESVPICGKRSLFDEGKATFIVGTKRKDLERAGAGGGLQDGDCVCLR